MKKIVMILMCILILSGCTNNNSHSIISDQNIKPNIIALNFDETRYFYIVDKNTHVVYLKFSGVEQAGITICLKADGTPMLAEDLGIKID